MSKRRGYRITVKANGQSRLILSITEDSNSIGTVTIGAIPAQSFSESSEDTGVPVRDRKYSIHPNPQSASTNTIHERVQCVDDADDIKLNHMSYTKALKVNNCLAPIFARATPDLRHKQYDLRPGGKNKEVLILGDYNPDWATLVYCLLLGPAGVSERIDRSGKHFAVTVMHLAKFDIIILSSTLANFRLC